MFTLPLRYLPLVVSALICVQCLAPAADRAERDATIGQAKSSAYTARVTDGLAAIRQATGTKLQLWQSAPSMTLTLDFSRAAPLDLEVLNTVPGSELTVLAGRATVEAQSGDHPKRRWFQITPATAGELELRLSPAKTQTSPFRFALMSDVQEAITSVSDVFRIVNQQPNLDFLLGAGDLTQRGERAQLERFELELEALNVPYYTTLGNHELGIEPTIYQELFGRGSFSFVHRGARFTLLDSASATLDNRTYRWLDDWLTLGKDQFHVIGMHVPPLDPTGTRNGAFASRDEALALFAKLQARDVDLTVYGHVHSFYDFDNAGIPAVISGGGGAIPERFDNIGRHFVVFEVDPVRQSFTKELVHVD
jgi:3',5'-cyclic-AMP phosphodiesterase